jgi:hypothetical protein
MNQDLVPIGIEPNGRSGVEHQHFVIECQRPHSPADWMNGEGAWRVHECNRGCFRSRQVCWHVVKLESAVKRHFGSPGFAALAQENEQASERDELPWLRFEVKVVAF